MARQKLKPSMNYTPNWQKRREHEAHQPHLGSPAKGKTVAPLPDAAHEVAAAQRDQCQVCSNPSRQSRFCGLPQPSGAAMTKTSPIMTILRESRNDRLRLTLAGYNLYAVAA